MNTKGLIFSVVLTIGVVGCGRGPAGVSGKDGAQGGAGIAGADAAPARTCEVTSDESGKNITITCPNTSVTFKSGCPGNSCKG
jgi:hypothetical protein